MSGTGNSFEFQIGERLETTVRRQIVTCHVLRRRRGLLNPRYLVRWQSVTTWATYGDCGERSVVGWRRESRLWREVPA
jgi:hypothetical protein